MSKLNKSGVILTIIASVIAILYFIYNVVSHENGLSREAKENRKSINILESKFNEIKDSLQITNNRISLLINKSIKENTVLDDSNFVSGFLFLSNKDLDGGITSFGIVLDRSLRVCEINRGNKQWEDVFGKKPYWGDFIEIFFEKSGKKSWALVIGEYDGDGELLNTSDIIFNELGVPKSHTEFFAKVRLIKEKEWRNDEQMVRLYKKVKIRKKRDY